MGRENILVLFGADSALEWGRSFQLAKGFRHNDHDVLYVDLPRPLKQSLGVGPGRKIDSPRNGGPFPIFKPRFGLPYGPMGALRYWNERIISSQVTDWLSREDFVPSVLWAYSYYEPGIARKIKGKFSIPTVVYDCADDRPALARVEGGDRSWKRVTELEREICSLCTAVVCITESLSSKLKRLHDNVHVIPNGVDTGLFNTGNALRRPSFYDGIEGKIVLYAGAVEEWIDCQTVLAAARAHRKAAFVFVGPVRTGVGALREEPNVLFAGKQDYHAMPSFMAFADLCIIPFKDNDVTRSSDPLKSLQYLAMERPVLSTRYEGVNDYRGLVRIGRSRDEFVALVGRLLDKPEPLDPKVLSEVLREYSWATLAAEALRAVVT